MFNVTLNLNYFNVEVENFEGIIIYCLLVVRKNLSASGTKSKKTMVSGIPWLIHHPEAILKFIEYKSLATKWKEDWLIICPLVRIEPMSVKKGLQITNMLPYNSATEVSLFWKVDSSQLDFIQNSSRLWCLLCSETT